MAYDITIRLAKAVLTAFKLNSIARANSNAFTFFTGLLGAYYAYKSNISIENSSFHVNAFYSNEINNKNV
jgi:hypothetical protein